jgi:hypothetical protein
MMRTEYYYVCCNFLNTVVNLLEYMKGRQRLKVNL